MNSFPDPRQLLRTIEIRCVTKLSDPLQREAPPANINSFSGWPPYMTVNGFLASKLWPSSRATLFIAMREQKFHSFLIVDGKTRAKSRIIDVQSALRYLRTLSEAAKGQNTKPGAEQTGGPKVAIRPGKRPSHGSRRTRLEGSN